MRACRRQSSWATAIAENDDEKPSETHFIFSELISRNKIKMWNGKNDDEISHGSLDIVYTHPEWVSKCHCKRRATKSHERELLISRSENGYERIRSIFMFVLHAIIVIDCPLRYLRDEPKEDFQFPLFHSRALSFASFLPYKMISAIHFRLDLQLTRPFSSLAFRPFSQRSDLLTHFDFRIFFLHSIFTFFFSLVILFGLARHKNIHFGSSTVQRYIKIDFMLRIIK